MAVTWAADPSQIRARIREVGLTSTKEGKTKIKRCTTTGIEFFSEHLR